MSLDRWAGCRYRRYMPSSYLIFDFGEDEQNAQQARHKVEGWKQGFRLGDKLAFKFEREQGDPDEDEDGDGKDLAAASKDQAGEGKPSGKKKSAAKRQKSKQS